ncbi:MAG: tetratricopeptide repeat protein [Actinomycetota bacterium]|nr:tetratricopeptide repeat protein [Actinomycetota bacterium]
MRPGRPNPSRTAQPNPATAVAMAGAVDLAALKARSDAAARAAEAPLSASDAYVIDVTEASFQADVLDRSFQVPVLLDLWADWCEPCKQLSPILEKLAGEGNGSWILARIDVEANPRISQALQAQSIPTVFAVLGGQLVPGFQGALPEAQVREFISALMQAATEAGLSGAPAAGADSAEPAEPEPAEDPRFDAAETALADGDYDTARQGFQAILDTEPANSAAALALHQVELLARVETADPDAITRADAAPDDVPAQLAAADLSLVADDAGGALRRLLDLLARISGDDQDAVRARLIEYFDLLGPDDERVAPSRREMARALF